MSEAVFGLGDRTATLQAIGQSLAAPAQAVNGRLDALWRVRRRFANPGRSVRQRPAERPQPDDTEVHGSDQHEGAVADSIRRTLHGTSAVLGDLTERLLQMGHGISLHIASSHVREKSNCHARS
jgi:hypothetical protein